jgi:hypothetical protein
VERQVDILLLGPDGHGRSSLCLDLARLFPPYDGMMTTHSRRPGPRIDPYEVTEILVDGTLLRLWDCAQRDWYRLALEGCPEAGVALLVFSPVSEIGPESGAEIESQLDLLRERGPASILVYVNDAGEAAARGQLARAERALRDLVASEDSADEIPILHGDVRALGERLARSCR